ncbi:MAG: type I restriction enzyme HsdR N-terminal domain-containing protein [Chlorobi bacterium]|nr:type I restriction enzyme HsdR N-terminal domain-containing protein [Chlorobiota bacterium]
MEKLNLPPADLKLKEREGKTYVFDRIRKKWVVLTPEEWVRQHIIFYLIRYKSYPQTLMQVEKEMYWNKMRLRSDLLVSSSQGEPLMLVECKAPAIHLTTAVFEQIATYNQRYHVPFLLVTNGKKHYCCTINYRDKSYTYLSEIPEYDQLGK